MEEDDIKHLDWCFWRMIDKHSENINVDYMLRFKKIIEKCKDMAEGRLQVTINEWKELDINNIPSDFLVNDRYEIKNHLNNNIGCLDFYRKMTMITGIKEKAYAPYKVCYRLKPLESIRITNKILTSLIDDYFRHIPVTKTREEFLEVISKDNNGRPVEIIEE
ncbi:MAG: hypothetical protein GY928_08165 [Colwellia sp.]|nr:hypothetical protein [Colwellia sp.]